MKTLADFKLTRNRRCFEDYRVARNCYSWRA